MRSFMKIPEVLALVGGFNSIISLVFVWITKYFVAFLYPLYMVDDLFESCFEEDKTELDNNYLGDKSSIKLNAKGTNSNQKSTAFIVKNRLCCKKNKNIAKLKSFVERKNDVFYLVKWILKVEFFMSLFLEKDQYKALELLKKPNLADETSFIGVLTSLSEEEKSKIKEKLKQRESQINKKIAAML